LNYHYCYYYYYQPWFVYHGLMVVRFMGGFGIGGVTVAYDLLAEWLPNRTRRGHVLLCVQLCWTLGSLFIYILLKQQQQQQDQYSRTNQTAIRWISGACALPGLFAMLIYWLPFPAITTSNKNMSTTAILESPRWLLSSGRAEEALDVLRQAVEMNGQDSYALFPESTLLYSNESQTRQSSLFAHNNNNNNNSYSNNKQNHVEWGNGYPPANHGRDHTDFDVAGRHRTDFDASSLVTIRNYQWMEVTSIFSFRWMKLSSALLTTYFGQAFCYHGTVAMAVTVFAQDDRNQNYLAVFCAAAAELAGILSLTTIIDRWGRIPTQCLAYFAAALASLTLSVWNEVPFLENGNAVIIFAFLARMFMFGGRGTTWVSTTEVLSSEIRTTGHAFAATFGRLGILSSTWILGRIPNLSVIGLVVFVMSLWISFAATDVPETHIKEMGLSYQFLSAHSRRRIRRRQRQRRQNGI